MEEQKMSIVEQLLYALANHMGGTVSLRKIADKLRGDADKIDEFYIEAPDAIIGDVSMIDFLSAANVWIPPDPDTVNSENLYDVDIYGNYLYPRAVAEAEAGK